MSSNNFRKVFKSRLLAAGLLVLIILIVLAFFRDKVSQEDLSGEIARKEAQIAELEKKQVKLAEIVDVLESADYIEREARLRLGLVKPGEQVVSVPENARPQPSTSTARLLDPEKSNPSRWFEYFFGE